MTGAGSSEIAPQDEFALEVVPPEREEASRLTRKLEPWHKPRKQLVRRGWRDNVSRLMSDLKFSIGTEKVFKYFTLPAPELLDVRTLEGTARAKNFKVQYVGFTDAVSGSDNDKQLQLGQADLRAQTDWIHSSSEVLHHRIQELAEGTQPVARRALKQYAPFHAVNLDFCDYLLAPGTNAKLLDALKQILEMQTDRHAGDWLLFIATRFDADSTCPIKFSAIREVIDSNCAASEEFRTGLESLLEIAAGEHAKVLENPSSLTQARLRDAISVGLTKWVASVLLKASPPFELQMMRTYVYAVDGSKHDLLSLVYKCVHKGTPALASGPTKRDIPTAAQSEVILGLRALKKTAEIVDLDDELLKNDAVRQALAEETKGLLKKANFSDEVLGEYEAWSIQQAAKAVSA